MTRDARFEDADPGALRLRALDDEDLRVISALVQDSVFPIEEMSWRRAERRFAVLLNRVRWEDATDAQAHGVERVRSVLAVEEVQAVRSQGVDPTDKGTVLSLLSIEWEPGTDGMGAVLFHLAGDGMIRIEVEALELVLKDVTRPYLAPSGRLPRHE